MPKLVVIILVYNTKAVFLKQCIHSIINSSYKNLSIIVVNDGSKDEYAWLKYYPQVEIIRNQTNLGIPASGNKAFEYILKHHSNASYITRVDSDDIIHKDLFAKEISFLEHHRDHIACCCHIQRFGSRNDNIVIERPAIWTMERAIACPHGCGYSSGMLWRTQAIKNGIRYDEKYKMCEDFDLHLQLLEQGSIHTIPEILYYYRQHNTNITYTFNSSERIAYVKDIQKKFTARLEPKVTVILTLYNIKPEYVKTCLNTLKGQKYSRFKMIIVDDYSSINYENLKHLKNVTYIRNPQNYGIAKSVEKAFRLVDTKYCVRLGSDDMFDPNLLQEEVLFLEENPGYIGVCTDIQMFGTKQHLIKRPSNYDLKAFLERGAVNFLTKYSSEYEYGYGGGMMFRSEVLKTLFIDESLSFAEDLDFHLGLLRYGKIFSIHKPLYFYRKHESQETAKISDARRKQIIKNIFAKHCKINSVPIIW